MSMISELVNTLRDRSFRFAHDIYFTPTTKDLLSQAADTIEELSAKVARQNMERSSQYYGGGWISVEERLPEITEIGYGGTERYSEDVLVTLLWYDGDVTTDTSWYNKDGTWGSDSDNCKVIAWQPLPPAYEPKED